MKLLRLIFIILLIGLISVVSAGEVTIIYTGSANGMLESCNCPDNPFGGLIDRVPVIDSLLQVHPAAIVVDVGDFLPLRPDSLKALSIVRAMQYCRIDAICPGDQDFGLGLEFIMSTALPFISASLFDIREQHFLFPTSLKLERDSVNIEIMSFFEPTYLDWLPDSIQNRIGVEPPRATWKRFGRYLKGEADMVIILSHQGYDRDRAFLDTARGVDLLISGHSQMLLQEPVRFDHAWMVGPGRNGEYVGVIRFDVSTEGNVRLLEYSLIPLIAD